MQITFDEESLKPIVKAVVAEVLAQTQADQQATSRRLAYSESEAAALLGLAPHQLRDERLRGRIKASRGPGRRVRYTSADLQAYLQRSRGKEDEA